MLLEKIYEKKLKEIEKSRQNNEKASNSMISYALKHGEDIKPIIELFAEVEIRLDERENEIIAKLEKLRGL